jgi:hypothetical protein
VKFPEERHQSGFERVLHEQRDALAFGDIFGVKKNEVPIINFNVGDRGEKGNQDENSDYKKCASQQPSSSLQRASAWASMRKG